jgi:cell division protein FtsQ
MPDTEQTIPDAAPTTLEDRQATAEPVMANADPATSDPTPVIDATPHRGRKRLAAIAAMTTAVVAATAVGLTRSPLVHARTIRVHGASHLTRSDVLRRAQIAVGVNVFMLDARAAERRLEADPWVVEATIAKHLPSTLVVDIQERSPVAVIESTGLLRLVAADGTLLDAADPGVSLPLIASAEASVPEPAPAAIRGAARAVARMTPALRRQVVQVSILADGTLRVDMRSGAPVSYGPAVDLVAKAKALQALLRWASTQGTPIASADVRVPSAPTARLG